MINQTILSNCLILAVLLSNGPLAMAQDAQERIIKLGHHAAPEAPLSNGARKFAELVAARSNNKMKIREFPSGQLGSEPQQISALQGGAQEIFIPATTSVASVIKEFGLLDLPFMVSNEAQADALLDGPAGTALLAKLNEKGLIGLGFWENGFRNVTNNRQPILKMEDLAGLKMRVLPNPVFIEAFKVMKVNPTPLSFGELYGALESKAVDAQENPYSLILSQRFYEVQKYASSTNHVYSPLIVLVGKKFWDKLTPAERVILQESFAEARTYEREFSRRYTVDAITELAKKGMKINDVPASELQRMSAAVQPIKEKFAASYDPAMVKVFFTELDKLRGK